MNEEKFNIFGSKKTNLLNENGHSLFLKRLLSPSGQHGLKTFFLESFMNNMLGLSIDDNNEWFAQEWWVETEKEAGKGRVDLYIHSKDKKYSIIIENKIGAKDQESQLYRYWRNLIYSNVNNEKWKESKLVYLSPSGEKPSNKSLQIPTKDSLGKYYGFPKELEKEIICISYKRNTRTKSISDWLDNCLKMREISKDKNPRLYYTLEQYKEWIDNYL